MRSIPLALFSVFIFISFESSFAMDFTGRDGRDLFDLLRPTGVSAGRLHILAFQEFYGTPFGVQKAELWNVDHGYIPLDSTIDHLRRVIALLEKAGAEKDVYDGGMTFIVFRAAIACTHVDRCSITKSF